MHVFFFQAEDGVRDRNVTGVQTCALPICRQGQDDLPGRVEAGAGATLTVLDASGQVGLTLTATAGQPLTDRQSVGQGYGGARDSRGGDGADVEVGVRAPGLPDATLDAAGG